MSLNMAGFILGCIATALEASGMLILGSAFFQRRFRGYTCFIGAIFVLIADSKMLGILIGDNPVKILCSILMFTLLLICLYKAPLIKAVTFCVTYYLLIVCVDYITTMGIAMQSGKSYQGVLEGPALVVYLLAISKTILFCIALLISEFLLKKAEVDFIRRRDRGLFLFLPVISCVTFLFLFWSDMNRTSITPWNILGIASLMLIDLVTFFIITRFAEQLRINEENRQLSLEARNMKKNIEMLQDTHDKIREIAHDFNNHLTCISSLIRAKDYEAAGQYISSITDIASESILPVSTHNVAIDAYLNQKYILAAKNNIQLNFLVNDLSYIVKIVNIYVINSANHVTFGKRVSLFVLFYL